MKSIIITFGYSYMYYSGLGISPLLVAQYFRIRKVFLKTRGRKPKVVIPNVFLAFMEKRTPSLIIIQLKINKD